MDLNAYLVQKYIYEAPKDRYWLNYFNAEYKKAFLKCCLDLPIDIVLEIGAHEAEFSRAYRQNNKQVRIFAFEANPFVYQFFLKRFNFADMDISYQNRAVSDNGGKLKFNAPYHAANGAMGAPKGIGSILPMIDSSEPYKVVEVEAITIDAIHALNRTRGLTAMHIDVEGAARQVLSGGREVFSSEKIAIINMEMNSQEIWKGQWLDIEIYEFLANRNFELAFSNFEADKKWDACFIRRDLLAGNVLKTIDAYFLKLRQANIHARYSALYSSLLLQLGSPFEIMDYQFNIRISRNIGVYLCLVINMEGFPTNIHYEIRIEKLECNKIYFCLHFELKNEENITKMRSDIQPFFDIAFKEMLAAGMHGLELENDKYGFRIGAPYVESAFSQYCRILQILLKNTCSALATCYMHIQNV